LAAVIPIGTDHAGGRDLSSIERAANGPLVPMAFWKSHNDG
jgi:hypothetical protein